VDFQFVRVATVLTGISIPFQGLTSLFAPFGVTSVPCFST
jgi:hypothetical protein